MNKLGTRNLLLTLTTLIGLLGCDLDEGPGEGSQELESVQGVGDAQPLRAALAASSTATQLPVAATPAPATTHASVGLPAHEQHAIGWVRWASGQPVSTGPIADPTGERCADGQSGSVFYLAGTMGGHAERSCTVPVGKTIVLPLLNWWGAVPESYYDTEEALQARLAWGAGFSSFVFDAVCELSVRLDGVDLYADPSDTWVETLEPFEVTLPDDPDNFASWFGLVGGTTDMFGAGFYARLPALPPGEYQLEFSGGACSGGEPFFSTGVSYALTIE